MISFQLSEIFIHSRPCAWTGTLTLQHMRLHETRQAMHGVHDFIQREGEGSIDQA